MVGPWVWMCKGWRVGGGAYSRWHATSTDISPESFPLLKSMMAAPFTHAVSFHGFNLDSFPGHDIRIGGRAYDEVKEAVRDEIDKVLRQSGTPLTVGLAEPGGDLSGTDPDNIVNRLAPASGGLQIEQSRPARLELAIPIAAAVAASYRSLFGVAT